MPAHAISPSEPTRRASPVPRFYGVQALRRLAAIMVVLHHLAQSVEDILPHPPSLAILFLA